MKIAIPSDDGRNISSHFGRCRYFIIYEIEDNRVKSRKVKENVCCPHRSNICPKTVSIQTKEFIETIQNQVVSEIVDCRVMIGRYMNENAVDNLKSHNVKVVLVEEKEAEAAIEKYLMGVLPGIEYHQNCTCCKAKCLKI